MSLTAEELEGLADDLRWLASHPEDDEHRLRVVRALRACGDAHGGKLGRLARQLARDELTKVQIAIAAESLRALAATQKEPLSSTGALHTPDPTQPGSKDPLNWILLDPERGGYR